MEKWAERIKHLLDAGKPRLTQLGLAKACGRSQPSISQWFNDSDSKPATQMILGDNLIAAANYLGTTPEWIMTGKGQHEAASQSGRLDPDIIRGAFTLLRDAYADDGKEFDMEREPDLFAEVYERMARILGQPKAGELVSIGLAIERRNRGKDEQRDERPSDTGPPAGKKRAAR